MKNISWSQLNIILAIVIVATLLLGIISGMLYQSSGELVRIADVKELNDAWIIQTEGEYDTSTNLPCNLEVEKGEAVSISHFLPEDMGRDYGIAFRSVYNEVQVKVGDVIIYQYGINEQRPFVSSPVPNWNFVPLSSEYAGQLLTITQISNYSKYSGLFPEIQIGSRSALLYQYWKRYGWGILLSVVLLLTAGGLTFAAIAVRLQRKLDRCVWYFLIFAGTTALWSISGSPLLSVLVKNVYLFWLLHILTRMVIPIVYLTFLRGFTKKWRLTLAVDIGIIAVCICYVIVVILQMMGLLEFATTYDILGLIYSIGFLVYTAGTLAGWLRYRQTELRTVAIANTLLSIAGIVNLFIRPNYLYQIEGTFWQISVMVYLFLLLGATIEVVIEQMNQMMHSVEQEYSSQREVAVMMMNPNFLFASLNTLLAMTKAKAGVSSKFVFAFSKYLRYNLDSARAEALIPFEEELKHIAVYLELQQMRIPELQVTIEDKMHDFLVPVRSIEAIVENAVKHGIEKQGEPGQVVIRSYERRDSYAIQIVDDGIGFDTDLLYRKLTPTSMKANRDRLEQQTGAVVEVSSKLHKGTIVTVKIPKLTGRKPKGEE